MHRRHALVTTLAAVVIGAVAAPAQAATPVPSLPPGFVDVPFSGPAKTLLADQRTFDLTRRGAIPGFPGNTHTAHLTYYKNPESGEIAVQFNEEHKNCEGTATTGCDYLLELFGLVGETAQTVTSTRDASGTLKVSGSISYFGGRGPDFDGTLPAPAVVDLTAKAPGWVRPALTRANAGGISRDRFTRTDTLTIDRYTFGTGAVTGRVGPIDSSGGGTSEFTRGDVITGPVGHPLGTVTTAAQAKPLLPLLTSAGSIRNGQNAETNASTSGQISGRLTTSSGQRLPGNTLRVSAGVGITVRTDQPREVTGSAFLDARNCAAGQAFDDCPAVALPASEFTGVTERIAPDGAITVTGRLVFRNQSGASLGSLPLTFTAARGGAQTERTGQSGSKNRYGDGDEFEPYYFTELGWTTPRTTLSLAGIPFRSYPGAEPGYLVHKRG